MHEQANVSTTPPIPNPTAHVNAPPGYCQCRSGCSSRTTGTRNYAWGHKPKTAKLRGTVHHPAATSRDTDSVDFVRARLKRDIDVYRQESDRMDEELGKALDVAAAARTAFDGSVDKLTAAEAMLAALDLLYPPFSSGVVPQ